MLSQKEWKQSVDKYNMDRNEIIRKGLYSKMLYSPFLVIKFIEGFSIKAIPKPTTKGKSQIKAYLIVI